MCNHKYKTLPIIKVPERTTAPINLILQIIRALFYYPLLLSIGVIAWFIYANLIMFDELIKTKIMPQEEKHIFYHAYMFLKPTWYFKFIKRGVNIEKLCGF